MMTSLVDDGVETHAPPMAIVQAPTQSGRICVLCAPTAAAPSAIVVFPRSGYTPLMTIPIPYAVASLAIDREGNLYVPLRTLGIRVVGPDGGQPRTLLETSNGTKMRFAHIAVSRAGLLFGVCGNLDLVHVFSLAGEARPEFRLGLKPGEYVTNISVDDMDALVFSANKSVVRVTQDGTRLSLFVPRTVLADFDWKESMVSISAAACRNGQAVICDVGQRAVLLPSAEQWRCVNRASLGLPNRVEILRDGRVAFVDARTQQLHLLHGFATWSDSVHLSFPRGFRLAVRTLLLLRERDDVNGWPDLPLEVLYYVIGVIGGFYT